MFFEVFTVYNSVLDPMLGIATGVLAYYLYENHPRTKLPTEKTLGNLVNWKWSKWRREREEKQLANGSNAP
jgi:hypothetical protein